MALKTLDKDYSDFRRDYSDFKQIPEILKQIPVIKIDLLETTKITVEKANLGGFGQTQNFIKDNKKGQKQALPF